MTDTSYRGTIAICDSRYMLTFQRHLSSFYWSPQPDITTYELARCLAVLLGSDPVSTACMYDQLPDECKRHFEVRQ